MPKVNIKDLLSSSNFAFMTRVMEFSKPDGTLYFEADMQYFKKYSH